MQKDGVNCINLKGGWKTDDRVMNTAEPRALWSYNMLSESSLSFKMALPLNTKQKS